MVNIVKNLKADIFMNVTTQIIKKGDQILFFV